MYNKNERERYNVVLMRYQGGAEGIGNFFVPSPS